MRFLLIVVSLLIVSCLPQEEGRSAGIEELRLKPKPCAVSFRKDFSLPEVAATARKMKTHCGFSKFEVIARAKEVYELALE